MEQRKINNSGNPRRRGGNEASLFAADLANMYSRFAAKQGWSAVILDESKNELGGYKEVFLEISGDGVYDKLKQESGVHRVQRVPATEKSGRVHTSTASVAVLPIRTEEKTEIKPPRFGNNLHPFGRSRRTECQQSGNGGQNHP